MTLLSSPRAALLASLLVAFSGLRADAHAPVAPAIKILPAHHATLAFRNLVGKPTLQSASFNKLTKELLYNRVPGYSGATSALFAQTKAASGSGILNGIYSKINSGQVGSGQLNGTFYQQFLGSNSSTTFQNTFIALGSNPLNSSSPPSTIVSGTTSFFSILSSPKGKAGSVLVSTVQRLSSKSLPNNPVELAALNGLKEGQKIATTGLTGGYLSGTWYDGAGYTGGSAYAVGGFAFGNNALNTNINGSASPSINLLPSYLTFLNKINVRLSSAQIAGNVYFENYFDNSSPFLLASGANPLNTRAANVLTQSLLKYPSYFKH